ncbi:hypothetical protein Tco_0950465, partial [Tanacetum coccineum]
MGASRRSRRLFLASTVSINDVYIDIPQQKLRIIGWADPEKIIKAIKKTRKIVSICLETEPSPATEQPSGGGARAPTPDPETVEPPTTTHVQECATPQPFGSKEAEEIHVVQHYPQDHGRHNHDRVYNESIQHYSSPPSRPQYKHKPPNPMHRSAIELRFVVVIVQQVVSRAAVIVVLKFEGWFGGLSKETVFGFFESLSEVVGFSHEEDE